MALRIRRGLDATRIAQTTPAEGELIYTTDTKKLFVGDGSTLGGIEISGVNAGTPGSVPYYAEGGTEINSGTNLKWYENANTLSIVHGSLSINNELGRRPLVTLDSNYSSSLASVLLFRKSKGTTALPVAVTLGEELGSIYFAGYSGTANGYITAGSIQGFIDQSPVASGTPFTVNYVSKSGTSPCLVVFNFVTQGTAPVISKSYTIAGNSNTNYNGSYSVSASTTSSMTLQYLSDPGAFGTGTTTASLDSIITGGVDIQTQTPNGNLLKALKVSSSGSVSVGPIATDFAGLVYDPSLSGQVSIYSSQTNSTQSTSLSQLSLRTFANTTYSQSINIYRARGTVVAPAAVVAGDQLHVMKWLGTDGGTSTSASTAAQILVAVDNSPVSSGKVPGAISFYTANATTGALTLAARIDSTQQTTFYGDVRQNAKQIATVNYITAGTTGTYDLSSIVTHNVILASNSGETITLNMPTSPELGQICTFVVHSNTATLAVGTGTVAPSFAGSAPIGTTFKYVYRVATTTWYKLG